MTFKIIFIILFFSIASNLFSQLGFVTSVNDKVTFNINTIYSTHNSDKGSQWIFTDKGLHEFDSKNIKSYNVTKYNFQLLKL